MSSFVEQRQREGKEEPFLLALGSFKGRVKRNGTPRALYGFGLAANEVLPSEQLLHPHHLTDPGNLNARGEFRWRNGVPLLRVWLCDPPALLDELVGDLPAFGQHHGTRVVPLQEIAVNLHDALQDVPVQSVVLDRAHELPDSLMRDLRWREGTLRSYTVGVPSRDRRAADAALARNWARYGTYTCTGCGYQPAHDPRVPAAGIRQMLDVHHVHLVSEGERDTGVEDLLVLCPLCHRREHVASPKTF
jgi:5-methylcytosine-specific restriction endonuclease McrA